MAGHGAAKAHKAGHHGHAHAGMSHHRGHGEKPGMHPHHGHPALHKRAKGGGIGIINPDKPPHEIDYNDEEPNVTKEAERKAHGGRTHKHKMPHMMHVDGKKARHRMDRPGRKRGGSVGADSHPLTEAAHLSSPAGEKGGYHLDREDD